MTSPRLRFGVLSYVNCLPATLALELGEVAAKQLSLRRGTPAQLNEAVRTGELDVSVVSAAEYLQNPELYHRLEDILVSFLSKHCFQESLFDFWLEISLSIYFFAYQKD